MDTVLKLRELRARAGLTQEEVARRSGVGAKTLSSFESGARTSTMKLSQLEAILAVYRVTTAEFFSSALDRTLAPWDDPEATEQDLVVRDLASLPNTAKRIVVEKLRLAIELAQQFGVNEHHPLSAERASFAR
jgi:transcriptional regulator with XRE-family HTH domain